MTAVRVSRWMPAGRVPSFGDVRLAGITKPITIFASGVTAAVDFPGDGEGIYVDLPAPSETPTLSNTGVVLHGLDIDGGGTGDDAIFDGLGDVDIEDCDLHGFSQIGVGLADSNTSKVENTVTVNDSTINGGMLGVRTFQSVGLYGGYPDQVVLDDDLIENASSAGVFTRDGEGQLTADHDLIQGNDIGFEADTGPASYMLENDEIDDNTGAGVYIYGPGAGVSKLVLDGDQIDDNAGGGVTLTPGGFPTDALLDDDDIDYNTGDGLDAEGTVASMPVSVSNSSLSGNTAIGVRADGTFADVSLASDTITQNATGLEAASGGSIVSYGADSSVFGNTNNGSPSSTVSDGAIGPAGTNGTNGTNGEVGATGSAGAKGPQGSAGANGSPGPGDGETLARFETRSLADLSPAALSAGRRSSRQRVSSQCVATEEEVQRILARSAGLDRCALRCVAWAGRSIGARHPASSGRSGAGEQGALAPCLSECPRCGELLSVGTSLL